MQKIKKAAKTDYKILQLELPKIRLNTIWTVWKEDIRSIPKNFKCSAHELQDLRKLVFCGFMAALAIILSATTTIKLGPYLRIGFSGYPNRIVECLLGPVIGMLFGGVLDILKFFLADGDGMFFWGYTFNAMFAGLIVGTLLYHKPLRLWRVVLAEFLLKLLVNVCFGTLWSSMLYGYGFLAILPARLLKNLIQWPVDSAILFVVLQTVSKTVKRVWNGTPLA